MNHYSKCLFTAFVVLLLGFSSTTNCNAQDEGQFLHAGLLGYIGSIEEQAILLESAAFGQISPNGNKPPLKTRGAPLPTHTHPNWRFTLRLWDFDHARQDTDDLDFGIGVTKNINEISSIRGCIDDIFSDDGRVALSLKATALLHLPAGILLGSSSGYFNPYLGLGLQYDFLHTHGGASDTEFGFHYLVGIEYIFGSSSPLEHFYIGLEYDFNSEDMDTFLLNVGFHF